jgi:hypothetical protein
MAGHQGEWASFSHCSSQPRICEEFDAAVPRDAGPGFLERAIFIEGLLAHLRLQQVDARGLARSRLVDLGVPITALRVNRGRYSHHGETAKCMSFGIRMEVGLLCGQPRQMIYARLSCFLVVV